MSSPVPQIGASPSAVLDGRPHDLGRALQDSMSPAERTRRGVWFTPQALAEELVGAAIARWAGDRPIATVTDPSCGGGAFLLAAHARLPSAAVRGVDIDASTIAVARRALSLSGAPTPTLVCGDGLDPALAEPADIIVGNPPFLSQLQAATARDGSRRSCLRGWYGEAAGGYVDDAALFLLAASRSLNPGGVAVMIVPEAILATESGARVRREIAARCAVEVVWRDTQQVFPGVQTCAIALIRRHEPSHPGGGQADTSWGRLLAAGEPDVHLPDGVRIGDVATATADFRDAYYLVADHVTEAGHDADDPRITPVGLIDPANLRWGQTTVRFAKQRFNRPVARGLPTPFVSQRLGPKLLVATQTRVLEALVDDVGDLLPTTPAITMRTDRPWHVGAALTSATLTAVAARRHAGAARSRGALKLSARQVLDLPLPTTDGPAWDDAAQAYRDAHTATDPAARRRLLHECSRQMWSAYDVPEDRDVSTWWHDRLPSR